MNDDDLEKRLRDWLPAEVPWTLDVRLHAARPVPVRRGRPFWITLGALTGAALAAGLLLSPAGPFAPAALHPPPAVHPTAAHPPPDTGRLVFGENLTVNIATGVQPEFRLAARRLDRDDPVGGPSEPPFSSRGISLKVNCQF